MEQIIVTILLVLAAIANWALFAYALKCDKAKPQFELRRAKLWAWFSISVALVTWLLLWLLQEVFLTYHWGFLCFCLMLVSMIFGAMACRLFDLQAERQKKSSTEE